MNQMALTIIVRSVSKENELLYEEKSILSHEPHKKKESGSKYIECYSGIYYGTT